MEAGLSGSLAHTTLLVSKDADFLLLPGLAAASFSIHLRTMFPPACSAHAAVHKGYPAQGCTTNSREERTTLCRRASDLHWTGRADGPKAARAWALAAGLLSLEPRFLGDPLARVVLTYVPKPPLAWPCLLLPG